MEKRRIFIFFAACLFAAGCASSGELATGPTKTAETTGKIYTVTTEDGKTVRMDNAEFKAYQDALDAKKKAPQNTTPSKVEEKKGKGKRGKKETETADAPRKSPPSRTYAEEEFNTALLNARAEDKAEIERLLVLKNGQANKITELEKQVEKLRQAVSKLQKQRAETSNSAPSPLRENTEGENNGWAGGAAIVVLFVLFIGVACTATWLLIAHPLAFVALSAAAGVTWLTTQSTWMTATGSVVVALICLGAIWRRNRVKEQAEMMERAKKFQPSSAEDPSGKTEQPGQEVQTQELVCLKRTVPSTHTDVMEPALRTALETSEGTDVVTDGTAQKGDRAVCVRRVETRKKAAGEERPTETQKQPQGKRNKKRRQKNRHSGHQQSSGTGPKPDAKTDRV